MTSITLTADQDKALKVYSHFLRSPTEKYMIIQGYAGSGKSTLISYLAKILEAQRQMYALLLKKNTTKGEFEFCLTATTNKAATVLEEITGIETKTIHSLLNLTVTPNTSTGTNDLTKKRDYKTLYNKLIIIDEVSMMNDQLFLLLDQTTVDCKVILIGDPYQLAPVKQTTSILNTLKCTTVTLNTIVRHKGNIEHVSNLLRESVRTGVFIDIPASPEVRQVDGYEFKQLIDTAFVSPDYTVATDKIIVRENARVHEYNTYVRKLRGYPSTFRAGETVYTNNPISIGKYHWPVDSAVYISKIGIPIVSENVSGHRIELDKHVMGFLPDNPLDTKKTLRQIKAAAKQDKQYWPKYFAIKETWLDLRPAYASTVHKTQGSQYDTVYIDLSDIGRCHIASDYLRLIYVACSRAIKQIYIYGEVPWHYKPIT